MCGDKGGCGCAKCKAKAFKAIRDRADGKAVVIAKSTGEPLEKKPIPRARALAQLRAIEAKKHGRG